MAKLIYQTNKELDLGSWHTSLILHKQPNRSWKETAQAHFFSTEIEPTFLTDCSSAIAVLAVLSETGAYITKVDSGNYIEKDKGYSENEV